MELLKIKPKYLKVIENSILTNTEKLNFILEDTISYFNSSNRCIKTGDKPGCAYSPLTFSRTYAETEGCAVGRLFEEDDALKLDNFDESDGSIKGCLESDRGREIHPFFHENESFFSKLQNLHDNSADWQADGLSTLGKEKVEEIKKIIH